MKNRRFAVTGLAVLAAASLALAGCSASSKTTGSPSPSTSPSAAPTLDATTTLTTAIASLATTGFDFTEVQGTAGGDMLSATGSIDPAKKSASVTGKGTTQGIQVEIDVVEVSPAVWAKIDLGSLNATVGLPKTWMSLDPTKITSSSLPIDLTSADLLDVAGLFAGVTSVAFTDPSTLTGTVDLTKATGSTAPNVSDYAAQAAATPFIVKLDSAGHVTSITVDTAGYDKAANVGLIFSNFGSPSAVTPPTGATPAPASVYSFLSGS